MTLMDYPKLLQRILVASGWSQEDLAQQIGVSFVTLNAWVNGKSQPSREANRRSIERVAADILGADSVDSDTLEALKKEALRKKLTAKTLVKNRDPFNKITLNLTYHTNTIEGSTMTASDVQAVLFDNKILSNRTQIEQREAINHQVAMDFLFDELTSSQKLIWTPELIQNIHLRMMNGIISNAGKWRNHGVRIVGSHVAVANFMSIPERVAHLCNVLNEETLDPIALLAHTHAEFEQTHPFSDGNGRTGRLMLFAQALQAGLVPPVITRERRAAYYKYLEMAQTDEKFDLLEQLIASEIITMGELL